MKTRYCSFVKYDTSCDIACRLKNSMVTCFAQDAEIDEIDTWISYANMIIGQLEELKKDVKWRNEE